MYMKAMKSNLYFGIFVLLVSFCNPEIYKVIQPETHNEQEKFWKSLKELCGKTFSGKIISAPAADTTFTGKTLLMHVRACEENRIRIPFFVADDRSRTWVFTKSDEGILLKHDHRHRDGTEDSITKYGGSTTNSGSATMQVFPADQHIVKILPHAAGNIWWVELVPGKYFTYNLRRMGTDRFFSIRFDLTETVANAPAPWGWKD